MNNIYVIGGANVDIMAKCRKPLLIRDSNPADINISFGGVAHNIACNLAGYERPIYFISAFSDDLFGDLVFNSCLQAGLDLSYALKNPDYPTSLYLAILDENKDMYLASSDMRIVEALKYEDIAFLNDIIDDDDYLVLDTNLDSQVLKQIYRHFKGVKVSDAISANKVSKLADNLAYIDILKLNLIEAETLLKRQLDTDEKRVAALRALRAKGAKEVIITTKNGAYLASDKIYYFEHDAYNKDVSNTTGAGDAFLAAYVYMHKKRKKLNWRVCFALSAAVLTVRSSETVAGLNEEEVNRFMHECHFKGGELYVF